MLRDNFRDNIFTIDPATKKYVFVPPKLDEKVHQKLIEIAPLVIDYLIEVQKLYPGYFNQYFVTGKHVDRFACHERLFVETFEVNGKKVFKPNAPEDAKTKGTKRPKNFFTEFADTLYAVNYLILMHNLPIKMKEEVFIYVRDVINVFFEPILKHPTWNKFAEVAFKDLNEKQTTIATDKIKGAFCYILESKNDEQKRFLPGHSNFVSAICNHSFANFQAFQAFIDAETKERIQQSVDTAIIIKETIEFAENKGYVDLIPKNMKKGLGELFGDKEAEIRSRKINFDLLGAFGHIKLNERLCELVAALKKSTSMSPTRALALTNTLDSILIHLDSHYLRNPDYPKKHSNEVITSLQTTCEILSTAEKVYAGKFLQLSAAFKVTIDDRAKKAEEKAKKKDKPQKEKKASFFGSMFSSSKSKVTVDESAPLKLTDSSSSSSGLSPNHS